MKNNIILPTKEEVRKIEVRSQIPKYHDLISIGARKNAPTEQTLSELYRSYFNMLAYYANTKGEIAIMAGITHAKLNRYEKKYKLNINTYHRVPMKRRGRTLEEWLRSKEKERSLHNAFWDKIPMLEEIYAKRMYMSNNKS